MHQTPEKAFIENSDEDDKYYESPLDKEAALTFEEYL